MQIGSNITVSWGATGATGSKSGSVTFTKIAKQEEPDGMTIYYDNSITNWSSVMIHHWPVDATTWPGVAMEKISANVRAATELYRYTVPTGTEGVVFNNGSGDQTNDITSLRHNGIYKGTGNRNWEDAGSFSGIADIEAADELAPAEFYNLQGIRVENPGTGMYIMRQGKTVRKVYIR
ncbi:MAG: starch-binding protein [Muribaculaceae bacterium]|nr:starch-binding protein [Muribaculaceae bacterium]